MANEEGEAALTPLPPSSDARRVLAAGVGDPALLGGLDGAGDDVRRLVLADREAGAGDETLLGGFEDGAGEEGRVEGLILEADDPTGLTLEATAGDALLLGGLLDSDSDTTKGLPLVAGDDEAALDGIFFVCEATKSDRPLAEGGEDEAAGEGRPLEPAGEPWAARRNLSSKVDLRVVEVDGDGIEESGAGLTL